MTKQHLYQQAKALAQTLNIASPRWIGSSIVSLQRFIATNTRRPDLPFLSEIRSFRRLPRGIIQFRFSNQDIEEFRQQILDLIGNGEYYINILDEDSSPITLTRGVSLNQNSLYRPFYILYTLLSQILSRHDEYSVRHDYIIVQIHQQITENPPLQNQRDGLKMNCVCEIIQSHLDKLR
jgi:hypothetical protein